MSDLIVANRNIPVIPFDGSLSPSFAFPIDDRIFFSSKGAAEEAARNAGEIGDQERIYYFGMKLCVDDGSSVTWYTIQRDGTLLADDKNGSSLVSQKLVGKDENGRS